MTGIIDKVKDVLHKDKTSSSTTHSTTGNTTTGTSAGTSGYPTTGNTGTGSGLTGSSNTHGSSGLTGSSNTHGSSGLTGTSHTHGSTNAGPHSSNLANKTDPRVDSDLDSSRNTGFGSSNTHGSSGLTGSSTTGGYGSSNAAGPHSSNIANKIDPRVDSDRDGSRNAGANSGTTGYSSGITSGHSGTHAGNSGLTGNTGTHGGLSSSTNAGPHDSNFANKADPRVDSDLDGKGNRHGANTGGVFGASGSHATTGSGTAQNTAGPHNSDLLNKVDPRVDSDRDGSKTYGGNATRQ